MEQHDESEVGQSDGESEVEIISNSDMNQIKVVISLKDSRGAIGIQAPDCDPILTVFEGDLETALARVPELVQQARDKWAENARYPKADLPKPPAPEPRQVQSPQSRRSTPASTPQQTMFE